MYRFTVFAMALEEVKFDFDTQKRDSNVLIVVCLHHMLHLRQIHITTLMSP
jgi:hypothetical protein